eukprot:6207204-Pleurochrysis_carterae.AAC.1
MDNCQGLRPTLLFLESLLFRSASTRFFTLPNSRLFLVEAAYLTLCEGVILASQLSVVCDAGHTPLSHFESALLACNRRSNRMTNDVNRDRSEGYSACEAAATVTRRRRGPRPSGRPYRGRVGASVSEQNRVKYNQKYNITTNRRT